MARKLKSTTIIPPTLYVERAADRQLREIISEMGRPAYILVARQMGKTNLLLNAKRSMEGEDAAFVYFDLSNKFDTLRAFYRHVIDVIAETRSDLFGGAVEEIAALRSSFNSIPHREYEMSLRALLKRVPDKLVIILDEIDALAATDFSDRIFSQIRSIYFARMNYPEYEKLTYVLSGVAEPSELIKDKSVSPFNIGDKVYLTDFSRSEFEHFVARAGLPFNEIVRNRIFFWCSGNPRMTWDLCAEVEESMSSSPTDVEDMVDRAVEKLYLGEVGRAPIDHIRTLVEGSPEIRDAIVAIRYGKGEALDDQVRARLYLAGITKSSAEEKETAIKNRIIDAALSEKWIESVERRERGVLSVATKLASQEDYRRAISIFEEYLGARSDLTRLPPADRFTLAFSYFREKHYVKAAEAFSSFLETNPLGQAYYQTKYLLGVSLLHLGDTNTAVIHFKGVVEKAGDGEFYLLCCINLAATYLKAGSDETLNEVIRLNNLVIEKADDAAHLFDDPISMIKVPMLYNLARAHQRLGDNQKAKVQAEAALQIARGGMLPSIYLLALELEGERTQRAELLDRLFTTIIDADLSPVSDSTGLGLEFNEIEMEKTLLEVRSHGDQEKYWTLVEHFSKKLGKKPYELLSSFVGDTNGAPVGRRYLGLLADIVERFRNDEQARAEVYDAAKTLTVLSSDRKLEYSQLFLSMFRGRPRRAEFDAVDYIALGASIRHAASQRDMHLLNRTIIKVRAGLEDIGSDPKDRAGYAYAISSEMLALSELGINDRARVVAREMLTTIADEDVGGAAQGLFGTVFIDDIQVAATRILRKPANTHSSRNPFPKVTRNQRIRVKYSDGRVLITKLKSVETDIIRGRCVVLDYLDD